jgi:hypothetical protein
MGVEGDVEGVSSAARARGDFENLADGGFDLALNLFAVHEEACLM